MEADHIIAERLNTAWRFFYKRGFVDGFGHISARLANPNHILISPHGMGPDTTAKDFVVVDLDGNQIGTKVQLPGELPIHLEIFKKRPDVGSVAHFHCLYATSFGTSSRPLRPAYFLASIFRDGIPIHPDCRFISTQERGAQLAETLGPHRAALMRAHGVVIVGADVQEMTASTFILEDNAHRVWVGSAMGDVEYLTDEMMAEVEKEILATKGPYRRIWSLCEGEAAAK